MLMKQQQKRHMFERSELCRFGLNLHLTKPKYQPLAFLLTFCAMSKSKTPERAEKKIRQIFNFVEQEATAFKSAKLCSRL